MRPRATAALLAVLAAVFLFAGLGRSDLINPDEPRVAEIAREMLVSGDLVVPRINGTPFLEKPPLFYWMTAAAYRVAGGASGLAARLVPALAALGCVVVTFLFARVLMDSRSAMLAALALMTAFEFVWIARKSMIDVPLAFAVLVACAALHRALAGSGRRRLLWLVTAYAAIAAAVMLKGLVGAAIPAVVVAGWLAVRRDPGAIGRLWLIPGGILALLPVGAWVLALHARLGGVGVRDFVLVNNVMRFTGGAMKGHVHPFWYYIPTLLADFAPWSLVLPFAIAAAFGRSARRRPEIRDLLVWVLVPLAVLSIASTKRGVYLLPIYPAAAMLAGWWLAEGSSDGKALPGRSRRAGLWILFLGAGFAAGATVVAMHLAFPGTYLAPVIGAALLIVPVAAGWRFVRAARGARLGLAVAGIAGIAELLVIAVITPAIMNGGLSARPVGEAIAQLESEGHPVALYHFLEGEMGSYLFYAGRTLPNLENVAALREYLDADPPGEAFPPMAIIPSRRFEKVAKALPFPLVEVRRWRFRTAPWERPGRNDCLLVTRGPAAPSGETFEDHPAPAAPAGAAPPHEAPTGTPN